MAEYEGVNAIPTMAMPMSQNVNNIAGLLPVRSAIRPMTYAPRGRVKNPAPKVANDISRLESGLCAGKNARPICMAKNE